VTIKLLLGHSLAGHQLLLLLLQRHRPHQFFIQAPPSTIKMLPQSNVLRLRTNHRCKKRFLRFLFLSLLYVFYFPYVFKIKNA